MIGWAPDYLAFEDIMNETSASFKPMVLRKYSNCRDLQKAVLEDHIFCGVCLVNEYPLRGQSTYTFHGDLQDLIAIYPRYMCIHLFFPNNLRYYNDSFIGKTWEIHAERSLEYKNRPRFIKLNDGGNPGYIREGFIHIQQTINVAYLNCLRNTTRSEYKVPDIYVRRFPERNYIRDDQLEKIDYGFSFMIILTQFCLTLDLVSVSVLLIPLRTVGV